MEPGPPTVFSLPRAVDESGKTMIAEPVAQILVSSVTEAQCSRSKWNTGPPNHSELAPVVCASPVDTISVVIVISILALQAQKAGEAK